MLTTSIGSKDIIEIKFLHKVIPTQKFNDMVKKINDNSILYLLGEC